MVDYYYKNEGPGWLIELGRWIT